MKYIFLSIFIAQCCSLHLKKCNAPTLIMAAEKDCLFPGKGVIERAGRIILNCETYLLKGRGHMNFLTDEEKKMIVDFLLAK